MRVPSHPLNGSASRIILGPLIPGKVVVRIYFEKAFTKGIGTLGSGLYDSIEKTPQKVPVS